MDLSGVWRAAVADDDLRRDGVELRTDEHTHYLNRAAEEITAFFSKRRILLRPLGNILYVIPPYCSTRADLEAVYEAIHEFLNQ